MVLAVLAGSVAIGSMAFVATLFQTRGLEGPVEIAPIAVVVTVLSVVAYPLVRWDNGVGYVLALLAGGAALAGIALYLFGSFGPTRTAPAAYLFALVGLALQLSTVAAWRERSKNGTGTPSTTTR